MEKYIPKVGEKLYLRQHTGDDYADMVKEPYTVIKVTKSAVYIQSAKCIFEWPRRYDSLPIRIEEDLEGHIIKLNYAPKKNKWQIKAYSNDTYPRYAYFGTWAYFPYLN